jgi:hypothetical protein
MTPLEQWQAVRDKMLTDLDILTARAILGGTDASDEVLVASIHKARYETVDFDRTLRLESAQWLRDSGLEGLFTKPLLPPGVLPGDEDGT